MVLQHFLAPFALEIIEKRRNKQIKELNYILILVFYGIDVSFAIDSSFLLSIIVTIIRRTDYAKSRYNQYTQKHL